MGANAFKADLTCKRGSVGQSEGLSIPRSSVRFRLKPNNSNSHEFELHRPSNKGTKLLLKVIKAIIIILIPHTFWQAFKNSIGRNVLRVFEKHSPFVEIKPYKHMLRVYGHRRLQRSPRQVSVAHASCIRLQTGSL